MNVSQKTISRRKNLEEKIFIYDKSTYHRREFLKKLREWVKEPFKDHSTLTDFLWHTIYEVSSEGGKYSCYLYFNERIQKLFVDNKFVEWATLCLDEIEATET